MLKKICSQCSIPSFSSTDEGPWICPNCQADLTNLPSEDAGRDVDSFVRSDFIGKK
ncbi:Sjogren's syndrome/scleroderma autoantigen 1 family protein [Ammoniphilus resinae]|uniref:Sjogren's syndrome/scleroderma autoantigen 1 family protein n=1 Tax=Ammoniphilus resinae TaxID=861532 RepID=UPI001AE13ED6